MAARGHIPSAFDGRSVQAPGMMRHGPVPALGSTSHRPVEPLPPPEVLENKVVVQGGEMDRLLRENQKLASTHGALRQELLIAQQEMQKVRGHIARVQTESDIQIRGLLDKISKMEAEIKAGESIKKELQQAHVEAQGLFVARQEMTAQLQQVTEELQRTHSELKKLPELHSELEGLMQEHQRLRSTFEHEKGSNMELVQKMHAMEKNLITMAREVEKLRVEVQNAEKRLQVAPNPYQSTYGNADTAYPNTGQANSYTDGAYGQGAVYANGGYGQVGGYTSGNFVHGVAGNYADPYGRTQLQTSGATVVEGANPYAGGGSTATPVSYDVAGAVGGSSGTYDLARAGTGAGTAYDAARAGMAAVGTHDGYDASRGAAVSSAVQYDPARAGMPAGYDASRVAVSSAVQFDPARAGMPAGYDASRVAVSSAVQFDPARVGVPAGYDSSRGAVVSNAVQYDPARVGVPAGYDTSRGAVVSNAVQYDPARAGMTASGYDAARRAGVSSAVHYDPARAGMIGPGAYDATRAQPPMQR